MTGSAPLNAARTMTRQTTVDIWMPVRPEFKSDIRTTPTKMPSCHPPSGKYRSGRPLAQVMAGSGVFNQKRLLIIIAVSPGV